MTDETPDNTAAAGAPPAAVDSGQAGTSSPPIVEPAASVPAELTTVEHQAERDVKHGLSHLEAEAVSVFIVWPEEEVKRFLAWVASKL